MSTKSQKIIMLGQTNVGKTAILLTFIHGKFPQKTANTLGSSFHTHSFIDAEQDKIKIDIWDTAGQEKYRSLLSLYYKNSDGVIITFDLTNSQSFQAVQYWTKQIEQNCQDPPCIILVGNKSDLLINNKTNLLTKPVDDKMINKFLVDKTKWKYITCSAKENKNVKKIFETVSMMIKKKKKNQKIQQRNSRQKIKKNNLMTSEYKKDGCC